MDRGILMINMIFYQGFWIYRGFMLLNRVRLVAWIDFNWGSFFTFYVDFLKTFKLFLFRSPWPRNLISSKLVLDISFNDKY